MDLLKIELALTSIGFSKKESQIYLYLLKNWKSQVWKINIWVKIARTTIYQVLDKLVEKWFILKEKLENVFFYEAVSPKEIDLKLKEQENQIKLKQNTFSTIFPALDEMLANQNFSKSWNSIYFEWIAWTIKILDKFIENSKKNSNSWNWMYRIASTWTNKNQKLLDYEKNIFRKKRLNKKINLKLILTENIDTSEIVSLNKTDLRETKIIDSFNDKLENLIIYWDKVIILNWSNNISWTFIHDQNIAMMFKILFEYIWEN